MDSEQEGLESQAYHLQGVCREQLPYLAQEVTNAT